MFVQNTTPYTTPWTWWADKYLKGSDSILWSSKLFSSALELIHSAAPSQEWAKGFANYFQGTVGLTSVFRFVSRITPFWVSCERLKVRRFEIVKFARETTFLGASLFYTLSSITRNGVWRYRAASLSLLSSGIELACEGIEWRAIRQENAERARDPLRTQQLKICKIAAGILSSLLFIFGAPEWAVAIASFANAWFAIHASYHKDVLSKWRLARPLTEWGSGSPVVPEASPATVRGAGPESPPPFALPAATT